MATNSPTDPEVLELFDALVWDLEYDYKAERSRPLSQYRAFWEFYDGALERASAEGWTSLDEL